jgi:hypothetical protein
MAAELLFGAKARGRGTKTAFVQRIRQKEVEFSNPVCYNTGNAGFVYR